MSRFMNEPVLVLESIEDVRAALDQPRSKIYEQTGLDVYRIKSLWLISVIDDIVAGGEYPYNATVKREASNRLGLPAKSDLEYAREGDALSTLIYNAQSFRASDNLKAAGYRPFTEAVLAEAFDQGKLLELQSEGLFGGSSTKILKARKIRDVVYAMAPRTRNRHCPPSGQAVRLIDQPRKARKAAK